MTPPSPIPPAAFWHSAMWAGIFLTACLLGAEPNPTPSTEPPKEYIVFIGADVLTEYGGKQHRVVGADRSSLEIKADAETKVAPAYRVNGYQTVRSTKLSKFKANIDSIKASSLRIAFNQQNGQDELDGMAAIGSQERSLQLAQANRDALQTAFGPAATARLDEKIAASTDQLNNTRNVIDDQNAKRPDELERDAKLKLAPGQQASNPEMPFAYEHDPVGDGLEIKCAISSPYPLEKAYIAVTVLYLDPRQPGRKRMQTGLQSISRITQKPQKVTIGVRNMPVGFHLLGCSFDLYGNGQEVPTNLSRTPQVMTEEQAYQCFFGDYLSRNRNKTRPPAPLLLAPESELRRQVSPAELEQVIYTQVDKQGSVGALSTDEAGTKNVPPQILSVLYSVRFFPALEDGKPVDRHVKLKLSDLLR